MFILDSLTGIIPIINKNRKSSIIRYVYLSNYIHTMRSRNIWHHWVKKVLNHSPYGTFCRYWIIESLCYKILTPVGGAQRSYITPSKAADIRRDWDLFLRPSVSQWTWTDIESRVTYLNIIIEHGQIGLAWLSWVCNPALFLFAGLPLKTFSFSREAIKQLYSKLRYLKRIIGAKSFRLYHKM